MSKRDAKEPTGTERLDRALRVIFERKGGKVRLVSMQRLHMLVPPPQALAPANAGRGSWIELRDGKERPVYRRVIADPLADLEVVTEDPERPLQRIGLDEARAVFFFIVPDIKGARRLLLSSESHPRAEAKRAKSRKGARKSEAPIPFEFDLSKPSRRGRQHGH
jgi:hypothetical protein